MLPSIERADAARTIIVPRVQPRGHGRLRTLLPWVGFGLLSVVVIAGTSLWSASLRTAAPVPYAVDTAVLPSVTATPTAELAGPAVSSAPTSVVRQQRLTVAANRRTFAPIAAESAAVGVNPVTASIPTSVTITMSNTPTATTQPPDTPMSSSSTKAGPTSSCVDPIADAACDDR